MNLENLNKQELQALLKDLSLYKKLVSQVGARGKEIFASIKEGKNKFVVEFFSNLDEDFVYSESLKVFEKVFGQKPKKDEISFIESPKLLGGMKIYFNDDMVDMSFLKIQNLIKK